jgi:cell division protein FtsB
LLSDNKCHNLFEQEEEDEEAERIKKERLEAYYAKKAKSELQHFLPKCILYPVVDSL